MAARITAAEARALDIDVPAASARSRHTARGAYHTMCHACGEQFTTAAAENRHHADTGHRRYVVML